MAAARFPRGSAARALGAAWLWLTALWLVVTSARAAEEPAPHAARWRWEAPTAAREIGWPEASSTAAVLDSSGEIRIAPGKLLLVPVDAGDQLRIEGQPTGVGWAAGSSDDYPDVITWTPTPRAGVLRVPTWSSARFLAVQSGSEAIEVTTATRLVDPMREHRLDAAVHRWLSSEQAELPATLVPEEQRGLRALGALRGLLAKALGGGERPQTAARAWLHGLWLEQRLERRRLVKPFFETVPAELVGGQSVSDVEPSDDDEEWRALSAGQEATLAPGAAEVVSFALRARAYGQAQIQIWDGDVLVHDALFRIPRRAEDMARWTPARVLRVVPRGGKPLRVLALEGAVRVHARARQAQRGLFEAEQVHGRGAIGRAGLSARGGPPWLDELLDYHFQGGQAAQRRLQQRLSALDVDADAPGGLAPEAAALIAYEILPALVRDSSFPRELGSFWQRTRGMPAGPRTALWIALLERLLETLVDPVVLPARPSVDAGGGSGDAVEDALLRGLLESVVAVTDGARPGASHALEATAARHAEDQRLLDLAREIWSRAAPWAALESPGAPERTLYRRPFDANQPSGMCDNRSNRGLRWWIVPDRPTRFDVLDLGGTHSAMRLLALDAASLSGAEVLVDGQRVPVQPALGESSLVALQPGEHRISHRSGARVIARVERSGLTPCEQLVEMERWLSLQSELVFEVPPGPVPTLVSMIFEPAALPPEGARVELSAGPETVTGWVRPPASGDVEIVVPANVTQVRLRSDRALLVRARARLHPERVHERELEQVSAPPGVQGIFELPQLTAGLRSDEAEREALRSRRGDVLHGLGYSQLAELDWSRAGHPELAGSRRLPGALFLPERPEPVVLLGIAARAPLLPVGAPFAVERALAHEQRGESRQALVELLSVRANEGDHAEALFAARLAAEAGDVALAAEIFERLGKQTESAGLLEAAAEAYDRLATSTQRLDHTERAFILAKLATRAGARLGGLLARYRDAIEWNAPSLSALGLSTLTVNRGPPDLDAESLGVRVRRALTLAPDDARLFATETSFNVRRWRGSGVAVDALCFNREGAVEGCLAEVLVDGVPASCPAPRAVAHTVALPQRCPLELAAGARQLTVRLPPGARRMGWARLAELASDPAAPAPPAPIVWQQTYAVLASEQPIRLQVVAPSVLRIDARGLGASAATLQVFDRSLRAESSSQPAAALGTLAFSSNPASVELPAGQPVSEPQQLEVVLTSAGPREVLLLAARGKLLVRPEIAAIIGPPEPPEEDLALAPRVAPAATDAVSFEPGFTPVGPPSPANPLSLSAELQFRDRDLAEADADAGDRYAETALVLRKALWENALWFDAAALARFRDGAPSVGIDVSAVASPEGLRPGAFASFRTVSQPALSATGASATVGLRHRVPLGASTRLLPELSATWREAELLASLNPDVDGDVYSLYAFQRPLSLDAKAVLIHRPLIDTFGRHSLGVRLDTFALGVDRVEWRSSIDVLPGSGPMPWLALDFSAGHRPSSELRRYAFTRWQLAPRATFWHWLGSGGRLRSDLSFSVFLDTPNPTGSRAGVFAALGVAYDFLLGEGLRDFRTTERLFRARLEEGGPSARPGSRADDARWREMDEP